MNYSKIMDTNFPNEAYSVSTTPEDYNCITFHGTPRTKVELDALWLPIYKTDKIIEINDRSEELIGEGFTYDSELFDAKLEDRVNYGHIDQFQAILPFPVDIHTKTGGVYSLEQVDVAAFIGAALTHVNTILGAGNALKALVNAATDEAGVDAVVDTR